MEVTRRSFLRGLLAVAAATTISPAALKAIEADEASHGNRAAIMALIADAKDNFGAKPKVKAKK